MAGANSNIQLTGLDFDTLKYNLKTFLQGQDTFKDYNFEGSGLNVLLDILAYNTQYNAYYLNMVANEMFLDSAVQRNSVVSHAKLLNYVPKSYIAPTATVNAVFTDVVDSSLTIPAYTTFVSEPIENVNYNFINVEEYTVNTVDGTATFDNVVLKQGVISSYAFTVDSTSNPSYIFEIPDANIDTTTLRVVIQESLSSTNLQTFTRAEDYLQLSGSSQVYFLQEGLNGNYEIYFGDGILGQKLVDGNIVNISYLSTEGTAAVGANNFVLMDTIGNYGVAVVNAVTPATNGSTRETVDSIKYQAPKAYSAQGRSVTKNDYITALQQNNIGVSFDSVNVWGGEENVPAIYGQIFISLKPSGGYILTPTQKTRLINDVINPISVMTVTPTIVDPDYTYIKVSANVVYDPKKTTLSSSQMKTQVVSAINNFSTTKLNSFNSSFVAPELYTVIQNVDNSIVTNEFNVELQKKIYPSLITPTTYKLYYNAPIQRGLVESCISNSPALQFRNPTNLSELIDGVFLEEVPTFTNGIDTISIINPGFGYQTAPTVTILGDGTGATATATINRTGSIDSITVLTPGTGYTSALVVITPASNDTTGQLGSATALLQGRYGNLRTYYFDTNNVKTILNSNAGTIDYQEGIVTLTSFNPTAISDPLGALTVSVKPTTSIISSAYNRIISIDPYDPTSVVVNMTAKSS